MSDNVQQSDAAWQEACAAALAGLPKMGPARLRSLLTDFTPDAAWASIVAGDELTDDMKKACGSDFAKLGELWQRVARSIDPLEVRERYRRLGIEIWTPFTRYPARLVDDEYAPVVLFAQGNPNALDRTTIGIIGTRRSTHEGRTLAKTFGRELSEAGISVMSGLALGIDGAAHVGACEAPFGAPPIAVVGNGLDSIYPQRHKELWLRVRETGLLISESPLGAGPNPWRFPARNRILAGLCDGLLVVESHEKGGSLITAREALDRNKLVMAVPGSVAKPAAVGTNRLLRDGASVAIDVNDVFIAIGRHAEVDDVRSLIADPTGIIGRDRQVLDAIDWAPTTTGEVMLRTGRPLREVSSSIVRLAQLGWVTGEGGWWQRSAATPD